MSAVKSPSPVELDDAGSGPADGAPEVRDGILARRAGRNGVEIRVEQRDGRRLLYIGDTLHAAVLWRDGGPDPSAVDPLVELLGAVRPEAKTALVIGLGSGKTAGDLMRAGLAVTAVEIEPAVIDLARKHFGYGGKAVAADGLSYLKEHEDRFDIVLMDAFVGSKTPHELVNQDALDLMRRRTVSGGITVLRLLESPRNWRVESIRRDLVRPHDGSGVYNVSIFGSGVGDEVQNLYLMASKGPLNTAPRNGLPLWPIFTDELALDATTAGKGDDGARTREVTLVGYVHRLDDGSLALDLPIIEMGAVRYLLTGEAAGPVRDALPAGARFPTQGAIGTDGDTSKTLRGLLDGGGVQRSDLRFSPVVAAVSGRARLVAAIHPNATNYMVKDRPEVVTDDRLPWGGALYEVAVSDVHWVLTRKRWRQVARRLAPPLRAAERASRAGKLLAAANALDRYIAALEKAFPSRSDLLPAHRSALRWAEKIRIHAELVEQVEASRRDYHISIECYVLHLETKLPKYVRLPPKGRLWRALRECAVTYKKKIAFGSDSQSGRSAAETLYRMLAPASDRKTERLLRRLRQKYGPLP